MSQITGNSTIYPRVCSRTKKHQRSELLALVRGIHQWILLSPHKKPEKWKAFPCHAVFMFIHECDHTDCKVQKRRNPGTFLMELILQDCFLGTGWITQLYNQLKTINKTQKSTKILTLRKWPPCYTQQFQINFLDRNVCVFGLKANSGLDTDWDKCLEPNRQWAITRTSADQVTWSHMTSLGHN